MKQNQISNLITDAGILFFSGLYSFLFTYQGKTLLSSCHSVTLTVFILLLDLSVPPHLVQLKYRILRFYSNRRRFFPVLVNALIITSSTTLAFLLPIFLKITRYLNDMEFALLLITGIVSVILSIVHSDVSENEKDTQPDFFLVWLIAVLILITLGGIIYSIYFFVNSQLLYGLLSVAGMFGALIAVMGLGMKISEKKYFHKPWMLHYIVPVWNVLMVLLWQLLFNEWLIENNISGGAHFFLLIVSGILLYRIIILLDPPVKIITGISGIVSLGVYIVFILFPGFFASILH